MPSSSDITDRDIYRYAAYGMPDFVKDASGAQVSGTDEVPPSHFADPFDQAYPTHTAAATWLSHAKFAEARPGTPAARAAVVAANLAKAAAYFGIEAELAGLGRRMAEAEAPADPAGLADADFALVAPGGPRRMRMGDAGEVKAAAAYLMGYRPLFPYEARAAVAGRVLARAAALGVDLGDAAIALEKVAGHGTTHAAAAAAAVKTRAAALRGRHPAEAAALDEVAARVGAGCATTARRDGRRKLAAFLDDVDRRFGLREGERAVGFPEDALFEIADKLAAGFAGGHVQTTTGAVYKLAELAEADVPAVRDAMGDELAGALSGDGLFADPAKLAAALPRLGRAEAARLGAVLAAQGIAPVMTTPVARPRLNLAELSLLATRPGPTPAIRD